eukprot:TRINITY_DN120891_c0_g1_i1.p1 TRINITY_DN120891_c0_g1~~TRINITY_DN120891_c0_g1_i1.p1  ORF type:complete len:438 (-),score=78.70 TRINITY_DN120891_c0_g1_i1:563-1876(-)
MGAILAAPLNAVAQCFGSCAGTCVAATCWSAATSGKTTSTQAACRLLTVLQLTTLAAAVAATTGAGAEAVQGWLSWICSKFFFWSAGGICACSLKVEEEPQCWGSQVAYRLEASALLVFAVLLAACFAGAGKAAAQNYPCGKFIAVIVATCGFLLLPNEGFVILGHYSSLLAALFLVMFTVFFIDFAYTWNDIWYGHALSAQRKRDERGYSAWLAAVTLSALAAFALGVAGFVYVYKATSLQALHAVVIAAVVLSVLCLLLSITEWCAHGSLLTSCAVVAYIAWLCYEALICLPPEAQGAALGHEHPGPVVKEFVETDPDWQGLGICVAFVAALGVSASSDAATSPSSGGTAGSLLRADAEAAGGGEDSPGIDTTLFAKHCIAHTLVPLYIMAKLVPWVSWLSFGVKEVVVVVSIMLYAWTLVAPLVLADREFGAGG